MLPSIPWLLLCLSFPLMVRAVLWEVIRFEWKDLWIFLLLSMAAFLPSTFGLLFAIQTYLGLLSWQWCQDVNRTKIEGLTKFALNSLLSTLLIGIAYCLYLHNDAWLFWPLTLQIKEPVREALICASIATGFFLLMGILPLQQGMVDLVEALDSRQGVTVLTLLPMVFIVLILNLSNQMHSGVSQNVFQVIAYSGFMALGAMKLVSAVQMNILRSYMYLASASYFPAFVFLVPTSASLGDGWPTAIVLIFSEISLLLLARSLKSFLIQGYSSDAKWDDTKSFDSSRFWIQRFLSWDLFQVFVALAYFAWVKNYPSIGFVAFYGFCTWSIRGDFSANRLAKAQ